MAAERPLWQQRRQILLEEGLLVRPAQALRGILWSEPSCRLQPHWPEYVRPIGAAELSHVLGRLEVVECGLQLVEAVVDDVLQEHPVAPHYALLRVLALDLAYPAPQTKR